MKNILVTGTAGFIGFHLVSQLVSEGYNVWGVDSINSYYDVDLKYGRLQEAGIKRDKISWGGWVKSSIHSNYQFNRIDLSDRNVTEKLFSERKYELVVHLAAQPGVRYSLENPHAYVESNIVAFVNVLEGCRQNKIEKLYYASSSSVYGQNEKVPFSELDRVDNPISLYAATKKSNELMASTYSHLYGIQTIGLRFFTVYGPWGRPDMAPSLFANSALKNEVIRVFNKGNQYRDFTYIDDIVEGVLKSMKINGLEGKSEVLNIGNGEPVKLLDFILEIERSMGKELKKVMVEAQPGDVSRTFADISKLQQLTNYSPQINIRQGVTKFIDWFLKYHKE